VKTAKQRIRAKRPATGAPKRSAPSKNPTDRSKRPTDKTPATAAEARILAAIRAVPAGGVAGYGVIARRAGLPGRARLVAKILSGNDDATLPWHRILRSDGRIAFPPGSKGHAEQTRRLRAEGVDVEAGRVRGMPGRDADLDALLWAPPPGRRRR
jgi:methylated-DNA-protein-cysteine methyltransferase-like protein